jgi:xanthine dehydrogenase/oxidase
LKGKVWSIEIVKACFPLILEDMPLSATAPGGQIQYRKALGNYFDLQSSIFSSKVHAQSKP